MTRRQRTRNRRITGAQMIKMTRKGQNFMEWTLVITCVVGALLGMQFYVKRALQGRLRAAGDQIGEQYEPGRMSGTLTKTITRASVTTMDMQEKKDGDEFDGSVRAEEFQEQTQSQGTETMAEFGSSLWEE